MKTRLKVLIVGMVLTLGWTLLSGQSSYININVINNVAQSVMSRMARDSTWVHGVDGVRRDNVPQWDGTTGKLLRSGYRVNGITIGDPGAANYLVTEAAIRAGLVATLIDSDFVKGPIISTNTYIPRWDGTSGNILTDGLALALTVGDPGSDATLVTEQGIREALDDFTPTTSSTVARLDSLIFVDIADTTDKMLMKWNNVTGVLDVVGL